jgi:diaminopimelate epimerase
MKFYKYHGLGNDFVLLEGVEATADLARRLCDRRHGVGADGVLSVVPAEGVDARMILHNADGSVSSMCGNGLRCVALHLGRAEVVIAAGASRHRCTRTGPATFRVEMGSPLFAHPDLPEACTLAKLLGRAAPALLGTPVHFGNPHWVVFCDDPVQVADAWGEAIATAPAFPRGVNASFAAVDGEGLDVVVHERGAGRTLACGSGACAVAVAAAEQHRVPADGPIRVRLPGGQLTIGVGASVTMEGPAVRTFAGEYPA